MSDQENTFNPSNYPLDLNIQKRDTKKRWWFLGLYVLVIPLTLLLLGWLLSAILFDFYGFDLIFMLIGVIVGVFIVLSTSESFFIRNQTTGAFVTIDQLSSLRNRDDVHVTYGPGTHPCYPWERRLAENNISLEQASSDIEFEVQCKDGVLSGKGSYRLRPDAERLVQFLMGVASLADEIEDLVATECVSFFKGMGVVEASQSHKDLNIYLNEKLVGKDSKAASDKRTKLEGDFGISMSDITISKLLPSGDVQKTIAAIAEAEAIQKGTLIILGYSKEELDKKLADGTLTQADVNFARDRFLAISGNLEGMDIKRQEFDITIRGLDPETRSELVELAKAAAVATANQANSDKK